MKKAILFFAVAIAFVACAPKAAEEAPAQDSITVEQVDTVVVDSAATVDSTVVAE